MKRLAIILLAMISFVPAFPQKTVEALFNNYEKRDDYTTVNINGLLIHAFSRDNDFMKNISDVRVISANENSKKSLYNDALKCLDREDYEELIRIDEQNDDVRILVKQEGNFYKEILIVVGGEEDVLVQIKGKIPLDEIYNLTENNGFVTSASLI